MAPTTEHSPVRLRMIWKAGIQLEPAPSRPPGLHPVFLHSREEELAWSSTVQFKLV
jgi:hypothetical protein